MKKERDFTRDECPQKNATYRVPTDQSLPIGNWKKKKAKKRKKALWNSKPLIGPKGLWRQ